MTYRFPKTAMIALLNLGVLVTAAFADNGMTYTAGSCYKNGTTPGYTTLGTDVADLSDIAFFSGSNGTMLEANVVGMIKEFGKEPLYHGSDRLSPELQAITHTYGTDRLNMAFDHSADIEGRWEFEANQFDWGDFHSLSLNVRILRRTDRI